MSQSARTVLLRSSRLKNEMPCFSTISLQLLRASAYVTLIVSATCAKYLLFPGTFYRQALVPQLLFVSV